MPYYIGTNIMAETLVLLRGLTRGKWHWGNFLSQVKQAFAHKQVLAIDLAGNGDRFQEVSPADIKSAVEDIRLQLCKLNIQPPYDVLGLSLGGMITLQWLQQYPNELDKIVVMNFSHAGLNSLWERLKPLAMCKIIFALVMPASFRESIIYSVTSNNLRDNNVIQQWIKLAKTQPVSIMNFIRQIKIARSFQQPFTTLEMPLRIKVRLLASVNDCMVSVESSKKIANVLGVPIYLHDSAGHEISLDDPDWVINHLN